MGGKERGCEECEEFEAVRARGRLCENLRNVR